MIEDKNTKSFTFNLIDGRIINKFGKNIEIYKDGVLFIEDNIFISTDKIVEIKEWNEEDIWKTVGEFHLLF